MTRDEMEGASTGVPTPTEPTTDNTGMSTGAKTAITVGVLLLLGAAGSAGYFYKQLDAIKKNPNKVAQDETNATIAAIGKLIVLPSGEQPTLATVTDPEKLKDQTFFKSAQKGDKLLLYTNAKKAILYSPTENKIVEVAPINIGTDTAGTDSSVSGSSTSTDPNKK